MNQLRVLRTPSGGRLTEVSGALVGPKGERYRYEGGVAFLYDEADVSPFLTRDAAVFEFISNRPDAKKTDHWLAVETNYNRARAINTSFLFSALEYDGASGRKVAEIGVGSCDLIRRFAGLGFEAFAVDFFPWEMREAREAALAVGEPDFTCVSAPMSRLPFADQSLDLVYFHAALHHALPRDPGDFGWGKPRNLVDCLAEVRRILKPDGALFLLGEGVYAETATPAERIHERICEADPTSVFEHWYKVSEYEEAYRQAGIYPHLFLWQENFVAQAYSYGRDGGRSALVQPGDRVSDQNYWKLSRLLNKPGIFPSWISVVEAEDPLAGRFAGEVFTYVHTHIGTLDTETRTIAAHSGALGFLLFGPYETLPAGKHEAKVLLRREPSTAGSVVVDALGSNGPVGESFTVPAADIGSEWTEITVPLHLDQAAERVEVRVRIAEAFEGQVAALAAVGLAPA